MKFIKKLKWKDIYKKWEEDEKYFWIDHFKSKGFSSWKEWRNWYINIIKPDTFSWDLYNIETKEILNFKCGAFRGWLKASEEVNSRKFIDLIHAPILKNNEKANNIKNNLPNHIQIIGFNKKNDIIIFEGNHRCLVISKILSETTDVNTNLSIALAEIEENKKYAFVDFYPDR